MKKIEEIILIGAENRASDIHIACGVPVKFRIDGHLQCLDEEVLDHDDCEAIGMKLAGDQFNQVERKGELDLAKTIEGSRLRINMFRSKGNISVSLRILASKIPELDSLNLPPVVKEFSSYNKGIILVTGETGSGKSTTMAAILNEINHTRRDHSITLEDPIEYIYEPDQCLINQREILMQMASEPF